MKHNKFAVLSHDSFDDISADFSNNQIDLEPVRHSDTGFEGQKPKNSRKLIDCSDNDSQITQNDD